MVGLSVFVALVYQLFEVGSVRPEGVWRHNQHSKQDVVLVTVNTQFFDMFKNWLGSAKPFLQDKRLMVIAEDSQVAEPFEKFVGPLRSNMNITLLRGVIDLAGSPEGHGSEAYGLIVMQRPLHILELLKQDHSVLYVDIDTFWQKDPFLDIKAANEGELYMIFDHPGEARPFCTCFLYVKPTRATMRLMQAWKDNMAGMTSNQGVFNDQLKKLQSSHETHVSAVILPVHQFPFGGLAKVESTENATVLHANWMKGMDTKIDFFKKRGAWKPDALET